MYDYFLRSKSRFFANSGEYWDSLQVFMLARVEMLISQNLDIKLHLIPVIFKYMNLFSLDQLPLLQNKIFQLQDKIISLQKQKGILLAEQKDSKVVQFYKQAQRLNEQSIQFKRLSDFLKIQNEALRQQLNQANKKHKESISQLYKKYIDLTEEYGQLKDKHAKLLVEHQSLFVQSLEFKDIVEQVQNQVHFKNELDLQRRIDQVKEEQRLSSSKLIAQKQHSIQVLFKSNEILTLKVQILQQEVQKVRQDFRVTQSILQQELQSANGLIELFSKAKRTVKVHNFQRLYSFCFGTEPLKQIWKNDNQIDSRMIKLSAYK